jgi:hypothetical protein
VICEGTEVQKTPLYRITRHTDPRWIGKRCRILASAPDGMTTVQIAEPGLEGFEMVMQRSDVAPEALNRGGVKPR